MFPDGEVVGELWVIHLDIPIRTQTVFFYPFSFIPSFPLFVTSLENFHSEIFLIFHFLFVFASTIFNFRFSLLFLFWLNLVPFTSPSLVFPKNREIESTTLIAFFVNFKFID